MPTNPTPSQPLQTTPVPLRVQRITPQTGNSDVDQFVARFQRQLADPVDQMLVWINGAFGVPPTTRNTLNQGTARSPIPQTTQTATQQASVLVGPNGAPLSVSSLSATTVTATTVTSTTVNATNVTATNINSLPAVTHSKYCAGYVQSRLAQFGASQSSTMVMEGATYMSQPLLPYAGSVAAITYSFVAATPSAGTISVAPTVNKSGGGTVVPGTYTVTSGVIGVQTFTPGTYAFPAGSYITFAYTTNSAYASASGGALCVYVYCYDP